MSSQNSSLKNGEGDGVVTKIPPKNEHNGTLADDHSDHQSNNNAKKSSKSPDSSHKSRNSSHSTPNSAHKSPKSAHRTRKMGSAEKPFPRTVTILHFNDVYNIEPREAEPVGGASRFVTAVKQMAPLNPMVLFSGDAFNPSIMSAVTKGKQMVPILNACDVQCAVFGNHDFDFGVDTLVKLANGTNFPWLMSNVIDNLSDAPLADGLTSHIIEWEGIKFGIVGLVEEEWIATLSTIDPEDITFFDYVTEGRQLAQDLKAKGADYIIALTHMRWPNDTHLAEEVEEIDIVLGGHDHDYNIKQVNGKWVLKSGTDFREMSKLTMTFDADKKFSDVKIEKVVIDSSIEEDPEVKKIVEEYYGLMAQKMETVLGHIETELDGKFENIRTKETNLGNFITDIMLKTTDADIALLNSGTLRSDAIHPRGVFKMKDLMSILPFVDPIVVIKISGEKVIQALENSVFMYPKMEGRFAQVAGVTFGFDPTQPPGSRVYRPSVKVQGQYIDPKQIYRLATKGYLLEGRDGYDVFKDCEVILDAEEGPRLSTTVQNHFRAVRILTGEKKPPRFGHRQSVIAINRRHSLVKQLTLPETDAPPVDPHQRPPPTRSMSTATAPSHAPILPTSASLNLMSPGSLQHPTAPHTRPSKPAMLRRRSSIECVELEAAPEQLAPHVDGRIFIVDEQVKRELEDKRMAEDVAHMVIREDSETTPTPTQKSAHSFFE